MNSIKTDERHSVGRKVIEVLSDGPAFIYEVAEETQIDELYVSRALRRLYRSNKIARRRFYHDTIKQKWLYLLPEHQPKES